jgi:hypothetical protein
MCARDITVGLLALSLVMTACSTTGSGSSGAPTQKAAFLFGGELIDVCDAGPCTADGG